MYETTGDGNCYFRAISFVLTGSEESHLSLRNSIVEYMLNIIPTEMTNFLNQQIADYITSTAMNKSGVWATDAEIMATASHLGTDIIVYSKTGNGEMEWLTYPASFFLSQTTRDGIYLENKSVHFNVVISVQ